MRKIEEIGVCPNCGCSIYIFKTNNHKRFAKCDSCDNSYALPKAGAIEISGLECPERKYPVLIVLKKNHKAYFWSDNPCFACNKYDKCEITISLIEEFTELKVNGY